MKYNLFYFFVCSIVFCFAACTVQTPQNAILAPTIRNIPGGMEIIPNQIRHASDASKVGLAKTVMLTVKSYDNITKPFEKQIIPDMPYRLIYQAPFEYSLKYIDVNGQTITSFTQSVFRNDSMTWDVVVGKVADFNIAPDVCNCPAEAVSIATTALCGTRSFNWRPSVGGIHELRKIRVLNPASGNSATFMVSMNPSGQISLITPSGNNQTCLTAHGFCLSDDNKMIQFDALGLFFSLKSNFDTSIASTTSGPPQKLTICCPASYQVTVEKLTCTNSR
jgi:hypothetical protein